MIHPLKTWLDKQRIRQWMFADMIGVDESTLTAYLQRRITPSLKVAAAIERETKRIDRKDYIKAIDLVKEAV